MEALKELFSLCKGSVTVSYNEHKDSYRDVEAWVEAMNLINVLEDEDQDVLAICAERDDLVNVVAYPDTPIGFYNCYHYDVEEAVKTVIKAIKEERKTNGET
jgi:hypothetical protein